MNKLKTSISLPASAEKDWKLHRNRIHEYLSAHLQKNHSEHLRRVGLLRFNDCAEGVVRVNVYWDQDMFNQLHAVSHALCMSVSHLLWRILQFVLAGGQVEKIFSNYILLVHEWSQETFIYSEIIQFVTPGHSEQGGNTPYRFTL